MGYRCSTFIHCALFSIGIAFAGPGFAETTIEGPATDWRMEYFPPSLVEVRYTGSTCPAGKVILPATASDAERSRLRSLIDSAQATGRSVVLRYETESGSCKITAFEAAP